MPNESAAPPKQGKIRVRVRYFSQLKELAGRAEETVDLKAGANVHDLLEELYQLHPSLRQWDRQLLLAAGLDFVERAHVIAPAEEISLMPPVQGG